MIALVSSAHSSTIETLLSDIEVGLVVTDQIGTILFANDAAKQIFGSKLEQTALLDWPQRYGFYLPDAITPCPDEQSPLYRAIHEQEADKAEIFIAAPNGRSSGRWCIINFRPVRNDTGEIEGAALAVRDITSEKNASIESARSNEALQRFASIAAHDLQEPLRSVSGFVDLLSEEVAGQLNEDCVHYMERIKAAVARMRNLINDLLSYSRIQSSPNHFKRVDCNKIVERCLESLNCSIAETGATVQCDNLPTITADASQLSQLFQNLIGNAIKFARKDQPPLIQISAKKESLWWIFSVKDNGIGVEMQFAERIFVLFQRLHSSDAYTGTGMGLAICRRIVEGHGGRIWMKSEEGTGSEFLFSLRATNYSEDSD